jgi:cytochrome b
MVNETDLGFLIIIPRPRCPDSWDTVTHETHHLVAKTLARTGVNDEESACYLHGWIINQLLQKLQ